MVQIAFPTRFPGPSKDFAEHELNRALGDRYIENLTGLETEDLSLHLTSLARSEHKKFLRNVILTSLVAGSLFVLFIALPAIYTGFALTYSFSLTLNVSLAILTLAISFCVLPNIFFKFEDLKRDYIMLHKHNRDALIFAANEIKGTRLRSILLDEGDKVILNAIFQELDSSVMRFVDPRKTLNLMRLGAQLGGSLRDKDISYMINVAAYIFVDPEIHQSVVNVFSSRPKKALIVWGINYFISNSISSFSTLVSRDAETIKDLLQAQDLHGFFDLLLS